MTLVSLYVKVIWHFVFQSEIGLKAEKYGNVLTEIG